MPILFGFTILKKNLNTLNMKHLLLILTLFFVSNTMFSQVKSQWRGIERTGIYPDTTLLESWPEAGPELLWTFEELGLGYSSAAIADNSIFIAGTEDTINYIYKLDLNGKLVWKKDIGQGWTRNFPGIRSTPMIVDNMGYIINGFGELYCFSTENGEIIWKKNVFDQVDAKNNRFGITENLVVDSEKLFCAPGGEGARIFALNRNTGDIIWESKGKEQLNAYCSPILINHGGKKIYVTNTAKSLIGIDTENGNLLWSYDLFNKQDVHANTPIFIDGYLFVMDGFEAGSSMLKIADDALSIEEVWKNNFLDETNGHAVAFNGNIYCSAESKEKFCCIDWKTGVIKYAIPKFSPGTVISADGKLICYSYNGDLGLVIPTENGFQVTGELKFEKKRELHIAHPVIHEGKLYIRYANKLMVYNISKT